MYGEIVELTTADNRKPYYVEIGNYRSHYPDPLDKGTRIEFCFNGSEMRQLVVLEDCETVHRLFDSEYAEKMEAIESKEAIIIDPPPSKFCKLKPDPLWVYESNISWLRGKMGGVLEIMAFNRKDGRYQVKSIAFPSPGEGFYIYPHEVDFVQYDPRYPNTPAQPINPAQ